MRLIISEEKKKEILSKHKSPKPKSVKEIEQEIDEIEKKLGKTKKETKEVDFDELVNTDMDLEMDRDSLEQS